MIAAGLLVLRLTVSIILVAHGAHQIFGAFAGPGIGPGGLTATAARFSGLGLEPGFALAVLAGIIQFVGGLLIAAGFLTRWAALAVLAYFLIVIWKEQYRWGFFLNWTLEPGRGHGIEYSAIL